MMKGRLLMMALPFEGFLVWLVSQLELFMSFLSPRLHSFFLILLSCHLSALQFFDTLLDLLPHSLFYACKGLVDNTYPKENTILKHGLFVQNFVVFIYVNEKMVLELLQHNFCLSCSVQAWLKAKVTYSQGRSLEKWLPGSIYTQY